MSTQKVNVTSPVGRMVAGSLYKARDKDFDGNPLKVKNGANAGQARVDYFFAIAIAKGGEQYWAQTAWGQKIWAVGHTAFPQAAQRPDFAWKIEDGDSTVPNKRGKKPCDNEGWPGHWILKFSGGFAPKVYRPEGTGVVQETTPDYVKPGYFIEVAFSVDGNGNQNNSGVYLNHQMVCFRGYGPEIVFGMDVAEAGFGQSALPVGATLAPPPSAVPMPAVGAPQIPQSVPSAATLTPSVPVPVQPNPQFLQVPLPSSPLAGAASPAAPAPPIPTTPLPAAVSPSSGPQMTAKANGASYQTFVAAGWTDANLIAHGYMTP